MLEDVGVDMGIAAKYIRSETERAQYDEDAAKQAATATVTEAAANDPKGMAEAAAMMDQQSGRPNLRLAS
jgi:hypothetical protein